MNSTRSSLGEMFQRHNYENVRPVSSASSRVGNVRMEIRPDHSTGDSAPQSAADSQGAKIQPGAAYENVAVDKVKEPEVRNQQEDPFEGFEEAIKNSEVISIKKVR